MRRPVCKRCGASEFREYGEIEIVRDVTRKVKTVTLHPDGSVSAKSGFEVDGVDDLAFSVEDLAHFHGYECASCGEAADGIESLVAPEPQPGDLVNLPDGRTTTIETTQYRGRGDTALHVRAAGEWWEFREIEPWQPHPDQITLGIAA